MNFSPSSSPHGAPGTSQAPQSPRAHVNASDSSEHQPREVSSEPLVIPVRFASPAGARRSGSRGVGELLARYARPDFGESIAYFALGSAVAAAVLMAVLLDARPSISEQEIATDNICPQSAVVSVPASTNANERQPSRESRREPLPIADGDQRETQSKAQSPS